MSASRVIMIQWSITHTAKDALNVSRGVLAAATSDNIQVIALLACEAFGVTLPICSETYAKVHLLCSQSHESAVLSFLKLSIGYLKGDSGWQLAQSDAGLRFLALAACLQTIDPWRAAELLKKLITESAADRLLVPTSQQIKQLLLALSYRLGCSGFADVVVGWRIWLEKTIGETIDFFGSPSNDTLFHLIRALSETERIGEAHSVNVQISVSEAPWIIAYIKWCLHEPPTVVNYGRDQTLLRAHPRLIIYLSPSDDCKNGKPPVAVSTHNSIGSVRELHKGLQDGHLDFNGMVHLDKIACGLLDLLGPSNSLFQRAGREAIARGCLSVLLNITNEQRPDKNLEQQCQVVGLSLSIGSLFPHEATIARTIVDFLKDSSAFSSRPLPENTLIEDLPSIATIKTQYAAICECRNCLNTAKSVNSLRCKFDDYLRNISRCIATIFLASLVSPESPQGPLFHYKFVVQSLNDKNNFTSMVYHSLRGRHREEYTPHVVLKSLFSLLGHSEIPELDSSTWAMSSCYGQTIYPQILCNMEARSDNCLSIVCVPGVINFGGEKYSVVQDPGVDHWNLTADGDSPSQSEPPHEESRPGDQEHETATIALDEEVVVVQDQYEGLHIAWQVEVQEDHLNLSIRVPELPGCPKTRPMSGIHTIFRSLFLTCRHDEYASLEPTTQRPRLLSRDPGDPGLPYGGTNGEILIVLSAGNEAMRYFASCVAHRCVIRDKACLRCCIHAAEILNYQAIIC